MRLPAGFLRRMSKTQSPNAPPWPATASAAGRNGQPAAGRLSPRTYSASSPTWSLTPRITWPSAPSAPAGASTPTPRERDPRLWPRDWVALCDGDAVRPEDAREIALLHTRTGRRVRIRLPGLRGYRIVGFSDGLLVLLRKSTTALRVLHPLTLVAVDFPSLATVYHEEVADMGSLRDMKAAVCSSSSSREPSTSSIAAVVLFPNANGNVVVAADGGKDHWEVLHRRHEKLSIRNTLLFQGRLYATTFHPPSPEIVQLYPPGPTLDNMVATVPGAVRYSRYSDTLHLVESAGRMLLVVRHVIVRASTTKRQLLTFAIYSVDFDDEDNNGRPTLTPVSGLGDRGCFSATAGACPSRQGTSLR
ncbi:hypothetical protein CFC21_046194 [Triticum aestivum]|uniref:KIB1-4 beta-propeller domain-containing protein n=2 Tax=Triticum aestivum TaxID=4565 RepID=A0A9R1FW69_WHEAT|nr:hypothetical protein CFC21_046194 [Triticum aestivum]